MGLGFAVLAIDGGDRGAPPVVMPPRALSDIWMERRARPHQDGWIDKEARRELKVSHEEKVARDAITGGAFMPKASEGGVLAGEGRPVARNGQ